MSGLYLLTLVPAVVCGLLVEDVDLAATQDVTPSYSDVVYVFQAGSDAADSVAQAWLGHMGDA